ncbi:MAG: hypothetical protein H6707_13930 [Deltaproteobacteria bacterium]|nr:hypothetical protein [Deltaproteobacteria bacterium]
MRTYLILGAALLLGSCDETGSSREGDGGALADSISGGSCTVKVDDSVSIATSIPLSAGASKTEYICPRGDQDYYKISLPAGKNLLRIKLKHSSTLTNVGLSYIVLKQSGADAQTVATSPPGKNNDIDARHCLAPGDYYVLVQDDGSDAHDGKNPYSISFEADADPDAGEDDNAASKARAPGTGYISCAGDKDYFKVDVGADKLLKVDLNASGIALQLGYQVMREVSGKLEAVAGDGASGEGKLNVALSTVHALPAAGTYYIVVADQGDDDGDPQTSYTLAASVIDEPDANDRGTRNDHPAQATPLGTFNGTADCASPQVFTSSGYIGSKGDLDYFRVDAPGGLSNANPGLVYIKLEFPSGTAIDPAVALLYADGSTSCSKDTCCRVLSGNSECSGPLDCGESSFTCIDRGDQFCNDSACAPKSTASCAIEKRCAGAVACLASKVCAAQQFNRYRVDGGVLETAQPLFHPGEFYLRVTDLASDEFDPAVKYTLTVTVCKDPDGATDNGYFPRLRAKSTAAPERDGADVNIGQVAGYFSSEGKSKARKLGAFIPASGWSDYISGHIAFEHDEDWYEIDNPCSGGCLLQAEYDIQGTNCPPANKNGSGLEFVYLLTKGGGDADGFPAPDDVGKAGIFGGDDKCTSLVRNQGKLVLTVSDLYHNAWSPSCMYRIRFRIAATGCPQPPCATYNGQCYAP